MDVSLPIRRLELARWALLRRTTVLAVAALLIATWKLWTPQTDYPQVPFFAWGLFVPRWADWVGAGGMLASLLLAAIGREGSRLARVGLWGFAASAAWMVLLDQHRAQPWLVQLAPTALVLAALGPRAGRTWLRALVIGIYFHSAVSKLDYSFCHGLGPRFWQELLDLVRIQVPAADLCGASLLFPAGELLIALGLCIPRPAWRTTSLAGAVLMHLAMLVILGPWGLGHRPGVLLWNVSFLVLDVLLFAPWRNEPAPLTSEGARCAPLPPTSPSRRDEGGKTLRQPARLAIIPGLLARGTILAAVLLPFAEPWGWWDHWPSWGLYSTRGERIAVALHESARKQVEPTLGAFLETDAAAGDEWLRLRLDRWSLTTLAAPVYPQNRFQLGVVLGTAQRFQLRDDQVWVTIAGPANRWTGVRRLDERHGLQQVREPASRFWLNMQPRRP
jgi:hypothetical protein